MELDIYIYLEEGGPAAAVGLSGWGCRRGHDCIFAPCVENSRSEKGGLATGQEILKAVSCTVAVA